MVCWTLLLCGGVVWLENCSLTMVAVRWVSGSGCVGCGVLYFGWGACVFCGTVRVYALAMCPFRYYVLVVGCVSVWFVCGRR